MSRDPVVIIGAGPTGLGAAWALQQRGEPWVILEQTQFLGGAAASVTDKAGFTWDYGGHVIHSHFPDFNDAIAQAKVPMTMVKRSGKVWFGDEYNFVSTPYQQQLDELPIDIVPGMPTNNLLEYLLAEFGQDLCHKFFWPFNHKMWGYPLEDLDHTWTSLQAGSRQANVPKVALRRDTPTVDEFFPYPVLGTGDLWLRVAEMLPQERIIRRAEVRAINLSDRYVVLKGKAAAMRYSRLISTMPLDLMLSRVIDQSMDIVIPDLKHTSEGVIGLGFRGPIPEALADKTYIYSPDPGEFWHRATVLSNYSERMAPEGCWSILFECTTHDEHRPVGFTEMRKSVVSTLKTWGATMHEKASEWSHFLPYGYPLPTIGRDVTLGAVHSRLEDYDVQSRGRFGGWRYESCNQDYSFAQGVQAARGEKATVLWEPESFRS